MSYFRDLSPYTFIKAQWSPDVVNVGWLDAEHPYRRQKADVQIVNGLLRLCKRNAVNRTRGWHHCPFCSSYPVIMAVDEEEISLGSAEIRLKGKGEIIFAAPDLVCHYMAAHEYGPPDEFTAALQDEA